MTPATTYRTALLSPSKHVQDQETFMCCSTVALINQPTDHTTQEREKTSESFSSRVNAILETWIEKSGQTFDGRLCKRRLVTEDIHELMRAARTPIWRARASTAFSNLRTLDLSRNQLTSLPDAFCRALPLLQKLNLSWNQLTSCPTALAHLTSLKELNLTNNQLSGPNALPGWLFRRWPDLRVLRLSANQITALPAELGELSTLEVLELGSIYGGNLLTEFPPGTLARLKSLVELNLTDNRLVELDLTTNDNDKVDRILPALMHLTLTNNRLAKLPEELAACRSLRTLCLGNNQLTNLPVELADLYDLEFLDITYNQLTFWPAELDVLAKRGCTIILAGNPLDMNVHKPENCQESIAESACQQDNTSINQTDNINHQDTISSAFETVHTHHINYGQKTPNCDVNQYHSPDISSPSHTDEALVSALQSLSLPAHLAAAVTHGYSMPLCRTLSQPPSAPSTPDTPSAWVTSTPTMTSTIHSGSIPTTPKVKSSGPPSLLELAARALLRHGQPVPYYSLPDHLTQYLAGGAHACAYCGGPFVGEWVGTLRRGRFGGHGVHRWLRYCSEQCQMNSDLDAATRTLASFQDCRVNFRSGHPCQNYLIMIYNASTHLGRKQHVKPMACCVHDGHANLALMIFQLKKK
jgi:Leucine-rich repeat (LRR) protein